MRKVCKNCRRIYEGEACPSCNSKESLEEWKGRVVVFEPEQSELAKHLQIKKPGEYAIRTK